MKQTPSFCPKLMTYGPCGDVGRDGTCEVPESSGGPAKCLFLDAAPRYTGAMASPSPAGSVFAASKPLIMSEFPEGPNSSAHLRRVARRLVGSVDAVLFGDSNWQRVRFPPSYRSAILHDEGLKAWPGVNCRDRNRVALEGELVALADLGVAGVHCVTGNHPHSGHRPDAAAVFDLDSTRLTELASSMGHRVSIAASPHTPPTHLRAMRTADKAQAGASICMLDQPADAASVKAFIADTRAHGAVNMTFIPVVSVVFGADDFDRWNQYPNARIPTGWHDEIARSDDPTAAGRELALAFARELLAIDGVSGILFGSTADPERADEVADTFAHLSRAISASG